MSEFGKELGRALEPLATASLSREADERIAASLGLVGARQGTPRAAWTWLAAGAGALALAGLIIVWLAGGARHEVDVASHAVHAPVVANTSSPRGMHLDLALFGLAGEMAGERFVLRDGEATLAVGKAVVVMRGPGEISLAANELRVYRGTLEFDVAPSEAPVVTRVSHGTIVVRGTSFTVTQAAGHGEVVLHHGRIEFIANNGDRTMMKPGETFAWSDAPSVSPPAPSTAAAAEAPSLAPKTSSAAPPTFAEVIGEIEAMRARRDTPALRRYLDAQRARAWSPAQRGLLQREHIMTLAAQGDTAGACAAISAAQTASPSPADASPLQALAVQLACEGQ